MTQTVSLGTQIKLIRVLRGLNQHELARKANISQYDISMLENGRLIPGPRVLASLEAALQISFQHPDTQAAFSHLTAGRPGGPEVA